jgi:hypothetical protein
MSEPKTVASRLESLGKVLTALTGVLIALGALDQALAKLFGHDSMAFLISGRGVREPPHLARCVSDLPRSKFSTAKIDIAFKNDTSSTVGIYWIGFAGEQTRMAEVPAKGSYPVETYAGHSWVVKSAANACLGTYVVPAAQTDPEVDIRGG